MNVAIAKSEILLKRCSAHISLIFIFIFTSASSASSQVQQNNPTINSQAQDQSYLIQHAFMSLKGIAVESRNYDDQLLRVRVQAKVADLLWPDEPAYAREMIITAFDDLIESKSKADVSARYNLRADILNIVGKHDAKLVSELIAKMSEKTDEKREYLQRETVEQISERGAHYIDLSLVSLRNNDNGQAVNYAKSSLKEGRSPIFLGFLYQLHRKDPEAADKLFLEALSLLRQGGSDPNDVLFLGLYLFTPGENHFTTINNQLIISKGVNFSMAPQPPIGLLRSYLQTAAVVITRFTIVPGQPGTSDQIMLKRFALQQLLPLFERYEPSLAVAMEAELARLGPEQPDLRSDASTSLMDKAKLDSLFSEGLSVSDIISRIEQLPDRGQRDHYFFEAARGSVEREKLEDAKAFAGKINENSLKGSTFEWIFYTAARKAVLRGDMEEASKIASSELTQERRAIIYYQIASAWLDRGQYSIANQEVNTAIVEVDKVEDHAQRAQMYIYLAASIAKHDPYRAFELMELVINQINAAKKFELGKGQITFRFRTPTGAEYSFTLSQGITLLSVVPQLASADYIRTVSLFRGLQKDEVRSYVMIEACQTVLKTTKKPPAIKKPDSPAKSPDKTQASQIKKSL